MSTRMDPDQKLFHGQESKVIQTKGKALTSDSQSHSHISQPFTEKWPHLSAVIPHQQDRISEFPYPWRHSHVINCGGRGRGAKRVVGWWRCWEDLWNHWRTHSLGARLSNSLSGAWISGRVAHRLSEFKLCQARSKSAVTYLASHLSLKCTIAQKMWTFMVAACKRQQMRVVFDVDFWCWSNQHECDGKPKRVQHIMTYKALSMRDPVILGGGGCRLNFLWARSLCPVSGLNGKRLKLVNVHTCNISWLFSHCAFKIYKSTLTSIT